MNVPPHIAGLFNHEVIVSGPTGAKWRGVLTSYSADPSITIRQADGSVIALPASLPVAEAPRFPDTAAGVLGERIAAALDVLSYGDTDGRHHTAWVVDQAVRSLTGDTYPQWLAKHPGWADFAEGGVAP